MEEWLEKGWDSQVRGGGLQRWQINHRNSKGERSMGAYGNLVPNLFFEKGREGGGRNRNLR